MILKAKENAFLTPGDAKDTLQQLIEERQSFDVVFIDADKPSYKDYYKVSQLIFSPVFIMKP